MVTLNIGQKEIAMPTAVLDIDYVRADAMLTGPGSCLRDAFAHAVALERERCATVAENMGRSNGRVRKPYKLIAEEIRAARIRIGRSKS